MTRKDQLVGGRGRAPWREARRSQTTLPGSTPDHLFLAAAELRRVLPHSAA